MRTKLLSAALAVALLASPVAASAQVEVGVTIAPPAVRYEPVPPPRAGWVWAPGYWRWVNGQYAWYRGHWIVARPGYRWVVGAWAPRGPRWYYAPGHWVRY
jgi:WXXGXW repeat (2 copies)